MMEKGPITLQESTVTQIIGSVLGSLEPEGSDPSFVPLEGSKEATIGDRGLEAEDYEAVKAGSKDNEVPQVANEGEQNVEVPESYGGSHGESSGSG